MGVSWYECVAYCRWLSAETGQLYRLPTEAEWEKAARGGLPPSGGERGGARIYPWGDEFKASRVNMYLGEQMVRATTPVEIYPTGQSPYKLFDCAGNVWEWCATQVPDYSFKRYPYKIEDEWVEEYLNRANVRVLRGGSWFSLGQDFARCACRDQNDPGYRISRGGCRVVVSPIF